jgi:hypothetical protein
MDGCSGEVMVVVVVVMAAVVVMVMVDGVVREGRAIEA